MGGGLTVEDSIILQRSHSEDVMLIDAKGEQTTSQTKIIVNHQNSDHKQILEMTQWMIEQGLSTEKSSMLTSHLANRLIFTPDHFLNEFHNDPTLFRTLVDRGIINDDDEYAILSSDVFYCGRRKDTNISMSMWHLEERGLPPSSANDMFAELMAQQRALELAFSQNASSTVAESIAAETRRDILEVLDAAFQLSMAPTSRDSSVIDLLMASQHISSTILTDQRQPSNTRPNATSVDNERGTCERRRANAHISISTFPAIEKWSVAMSSACVCFDPAMIQAHHYSSARGVALVAAPVVSTRISLTIKLGTAPFKNGQFSVGLAPRHSMDIESANFAGFGSVRSSVGISQWSHESMVLAGGTMVAQCGDLREGDCIKVAVDLLLGQVSVFVNESLVGVCSGPGLDSSDLFVLGATLPRGHRINIHGDGGDNGGRGGSRARVDGVDSDHLGEHQVSNGEQPFSESPRRGGSGLASADSAPAHSGSSLVMSDMSRLWPSQMGVGMGMGADRGDETLSYEEDGDVEEEELEALAQSMARAIVEPHRSGRTSNSGAIVGATGRGRGGALTQCNPMIRPTVCTGFAGGYAPAPTRAGVLRHSGLASLCPPDYLVSHNTGTSITNCDDHDTVLGNGADVFGAGLQMMDEGTNLRVGETMRSTPVDWEGRSGLRPDVQGSVGAHRVLHHRSPISEDVLQTSSLQLPSPSSTSSSSSSSGSLLTTLSAALPTMRHSLSTSSLASRLSQAQLRGVNAQESSGAERYQRQGRFDSRIPGDRNIGGRGNRGSRGGEREGGGGTTVGDDEHELVAKFDEDSAAPSSPSPSSTHLSQLSTESDRGVNDGTAFTRPIPRQAPGPQLSAVAQRRLDFLARESMARNDEPSRGAAAGGDVSSRQRGSTGSGGLGALFDHQSGGDGSSYIGRRRSSDQGGARTLFQEGVGREWQVSDDRHSGPLSNSSASWSYPNFNMHSMRPSPLLDDDDDDDDSRVERICRRNMVLSLAQSTSQPQAHASVHSSSQTSAAPISVSNRTEGSDGLMGAECLLSESNTKAKKGHECIGGASELPQFCCICMEGSKCVVLLPCRHMCLCDNCGSDVVAVLKLCPICREVIDQSIRIFT